MAAYVVILGSLDAKGCRKTLCHAPTITLVRTMVDEMEKMILPFVSGGQ